MFFFGKKENCMLCDCKGHKRLINGYICNQCFEKCSTITTNILNLGGKSKEELQNLIDAYNKNEALIHKFTVTNSIGNFFKVDEINKLWMIQNITKKKPIVRRYEDIIEYELIENGEIIFKSNINKIVLGSVLFGGVGAIIAGIKPRKKNKYLKVSLRIKVKANDKTTPFIYVYVIKDFKLKEDSISHQILLKYVKSILSILTIIKEENKKNSLINEISEVI